MVLYRKYRPQKLSELDLLNIRERLITVFSSSFTPHALLFAGPKGTGKTSAARIVAKILNCERKLHKPQSNIEPCNSCEACIAITEGRHLDILEIDAASNRGIDEIRELREKIKFTPVSARYKVYIIDEAHMLTNEAFNALLKTLEEPPSHAIFILATTEVEKLPETIISRCIRFDFHKASDEEILASLKRVVKGEEMAFSPEVLSVIAERAEGSFRDGTKYLEQAILEKVKTKEDILRLFGRDAYSTEKFLRLLHEKKGKEILEMILLMGQKGVDFRFFVVEILNQLHRLLLALHGIEKEKADEKLVTLFEVKEINNLIQLFSKVYVEIRSASKPELPIEVAVVQWCENNKG